MTIAFNYPIICMHFRFSCMFSFRSLVGLAVEEHKKITHLAADFKLCQKLKNIYWKGENQRAKNFPFRIYLSATIMIINKNNSSGISRT